MAADRAEVRGTLPTGLDYAADLSADVLTLRVGERVCVVHPRWMSLEQARRVAAALLNVAPVGGS